MDSSRRNAQRVVGASVARTTKLERVEAPVEPISSRSTCRRRSTDPVHWHALEPCLEPCEDEIDDGQRSSHFGIPGNGAVIVHSAGRRNRPPSVTINVPERPASTNERVWPRSTSTAASTRPVAPSFRLSRAVPGLRWRTSTAQATRTLWCTPRPSPRVRRHRFRPLRLFVRAHRYPGAADHSGAKLMEDLEGCLIARYPTLPLKLDGRHALSSGWRPGRQPRTKWTMACDCAP